MTHIRPKALRRRAPSATGPDGFNDPNRPDFFDQVVFVLFRGGCHGGVNH